MSSQKKLSLWQRIKHLLKTDNAQKLPSAKHIATPIASTAKQSVSTAKKDDEQLSDNCPLKDDSHVNADNTQVANRYTGSRTSSVETTATDSSPQSPKGENSHAEKDSDASSPQADSSSFDKEETSHQQSKFITLSNLEASDTMKRRSASYQYSDKPITEAVLDFLEASDLSYYYHYSENNTAADDANKATNADTSEDTPTSSQNTSQNNAARAASNVHHISMAMRYYSEESMDSDANEQPDDVDDSLEDMSTTNSGDLEWGCVIRIHEHTQLIAIYGVLPFYLPPSHLQAGVTLATQLNYDMMLGCVEIDIRDGEIRFKNSLDLEPVMNASGGIVPPTVISYLLKSIMAMTSSFAPLFSDLVNNRPDKYELQHILEQLQKERAGNTFFLASETPQ